MVIVIVLFPTDIFVHMHDNNSYVSYLLYTLYNFYPEICKVELLDNELIIEKKKYEVEPSVGYCEYAMDRKGKERKIKHEKTKTAKKETLQARLICTLLSVLLHTATFTDQVEISSSVIQPAHAGPELALLQSRNREDSFLPRVWPVPLVSSQEAQRMRSILEDVVVLGLFTRDDFVNFLSDRDKSFDESK